MSSTQKLITTLQSSPYYADVQKLQTDHLASIQASIAQIHNPISTYREAVRSGSTMRVQEYQATIDAYVREVVELHEEEKRRWDIVMERLAEDVGGRLGRVLTEVMREMNGRGGECMGREMNLEGVVAEVAEKMDLEK